MALHPGDRRLAADLRDIDDRGLEDAEALIHELRHAQPVSARFDDRIPRALRALSTVRTLTKRGR
jgi:hypothetical protein